MRYLSVVLWVLAIIVIVVFFVNNTQEFTLEFAGYRMARPFQLWVLMLCFFLAGTLPVALVQLPAYARRLRRVHALRRRMRSLQHELSTITASRSSGQAPEEIQDSTR